MAIKEDWTQGTVSITTNTATLTGVGTNWLISGYVRAGDDFRPRTGLVVPILSVNSDTSITLAYNYPGATLSAQPYAIRYQADGSRYAAAAQDLVARLANGVLENLAAVPGAAANMVPYFTGAAAWATTSLTSFGRSIIGGADAGAVQTILGMSTYFKTLLPAADAGAFQTLLGMSAYFKTLLAAANAGALQTLLGMSTYFKTLLAAADASAFQTLIGMSTFFKTLLASATGVAFQTTLGISPYGTLQRRTLVTTSNAAFALQASTRYWRAHGIAAGGGGGGVDGTGTGGAVGGGGGSGAEGWTNFITVVAGTLNIGVGAPGAGGVAALQGNAGGNTTIVYNAVTYTWVGGGGGDGAVSSASTSVSFGGTVGGTTNLVVSGGSPGQHGVVSALNVLSGYGGSTQFGKGGTTVGASAGNAVAGISGVGMGSGGSGAACSATTTNANGGSGAGGGVWIEEYA